MEFSFSHQDSSSDGLLDVRQGLKHLLGGETLVALVHGREVRFSYRDKNVLVREENAFYPLSAQDFLSLYKDCAFQTEEEEEDSVDPKKDEEYYSWGNKTGIGL